MKAKQLIRRLLFIVQLVCLHQTAAQSILNLDINGETSSLCQPIWDMELKHETGEVCFKGEPWDSQQLKATYTTKDHWKLKEIYLWVGSNPQYIPLTVDSVPFKNDTVGGHDNFSFEIPFTDIGFFCNSEGQHSTFLIVSLVLMENIYVNEGPEISGSDYWAEFDLGMGGWTNFHLTLSCPDPPDMQITPQHASEDISEDSLEVSLESESAEFISKDSRSTDCSNTDDENSLSADFLRKVRIITNLSWVSLEPDVYNETLQLTYYDSFEYWEDRADDMHLLAKSEGVCYAAFRGTQAGAVFDFAQNIFVTPKRIEGSNCFARNGFYGSYYTHYVGSFRAAVNDCVKSCDGGCELVMGGASSGAAAALVGALDLRVLNPLVILIGGAKTIFESNWWNPISSIKCTDIDDLTIYRLTFLQLERTHQGVHYDTHYDQIPFDFGYGATQFGQHLIVDTNGLTVNVGTDTVDRFPKLTFFHSKMFLLDWLTTFTSQECVPVSTSGWPDGHWCSRNDECFSGRCRDNSCKRKLEIGDRCFMHTDCASQWCGRPRWFSVRRCQ